MHNWDNIEEWGTLSEDNKIRDGFPIFKEKILKDKALKKIVKNNQIHTLKARALSDLCFKPKPEEQYRIITEKQFNAYALILHLLETTIIDELYLAIYRINEPTVESIIDFIQAGKIKKATFVISNFFNQTRKPEKWAIRLKEFCDTQDNCNHVYMHNHAKVLALKTECNNFYIFEGSGNMSDNARIEQYIYENNEKVFNFHKEWMTKLIQLRLNSNGR
jgi:hypothetical protein